MKSWLQRFFFIPVCNGERLLKFFKSNSSLTETEKTHFISFSSLLNIISFIILNSKCNLEWNKKLYRWKNRHFSWNFKRVLFQELRICPVSYNHLFFPLSTLFFLSLIVSFKSFTYKHSWLEESTCLQTIQTKDTVKYHMKCFSQCRRCSVFSCVQFPSYINSVS